MHVQAPLKHFFWIKPGGLFIILNHSRTDVSKITMFSALFSSRKILTMTLKPQRYTDS